MLNWDKVNDPRLMQKVILMQGLAQELSAEGACERAIYPDPNNFVASCAIGNLYAEGVRTSHPLIFLFLVYLSPLLGCMILWYTRRKFIYYTCKLLQGNSCKLNLVPGCMDPSSPSFNPLANVDDGSCPWRLMPMKNNFLGMLQKTFTIQLINVQ